MEYNCSRCNRKLRPFVNPVDDIPYYIFKSYSNSEIICSCCYNSLKKKALGFSLGMNFSVNNYIT